MSQALAPAQAKKKAAAWSCVDVVTWIVLLAFLAYFAVFAFQMHQLLFPHHYFVAVDESVVTVVRPLWNLGTPLHMKVFVTKQAHWPGVDGALLVYDTSDADASVGFISEVSDEAEEEKGDEEQILARKQRQMDMRRSLHARVQSAFVLGEPLLLNLSVPVSAMQVDFDDSSIATSSSPIRTPASASAHMHVFIGNKALSLSKRGASSSFIHAFNMPAAYVNCIHLDTPLVAIRTLHSDNDTQVLVNLGQVSSSSSPASSSSSPASSSSSSSSSSPSESSSSDIKETKGNKIKTPHWKTRVSALVVRDEIDFPYNQVPDDINYFLNVITESESSESAEKGNDANSDDSNDEKSDGNIKQTNIKKNRGGSGYIPLSVIENLSVRSVDYMPINSSALAFPVQLHIQPVSLGWWRFIRSMDYALETTVGPMLGDEEQKDVLRSLYTETHPVLLAITIVVSFVHMALDFLALKNDYLFWKSRKSMVGISARTVVMEFVSRFIVFLYLLDSETSNLVLVPSGLNVLINLWKSLKVTRIRVHWPWSNRVVANNNNSINSIWGRFLPSVEFAWASDSTAAGGAGTTEAERQTAALDEEATRYMVIFVTPLLAIYFCYSLLFHRHKSWYSWLIQSLASAIYAGGFVLMTPQLFINYRRKSVAHMPWRAFVYRFANTVIDDLFAFVIKMPMLHRISCFRDDIIFVIYLYQRWIYPVDMTRTETEDGSEISDPIIAEEGTEYEKKQK